MSFIVPEAVEAYAAARSQPVPPILESLAADTFARAECPQMISGELAGGVLRMVARLIGARRVLEVGMFTGFGTLSLAEGVSDGGEVHTLEVDPSCLDVALPHFEVSPHGDKIHVHIGPALDSMRRLEGPFDLVFIDADKENYLAYYEEAMRLVRPGGVILVDNALWSGRVLEPDDSCSAAIDQLNRHIEVDERVDRLLLTIRDGMFLVRKR